MSTQSFSKVGHLAAHEQVVLVHDLFFSQAVILKGGEATFVRTYTIVLTRVKKTSGCVCFFSAYNAGVFVCESLIRLLC